MYVCVNALIPSLVSYIAPSLTLSSPLPHSNRRPSVSLDKEIPGTDWLLIEFRAHLMNDLQQRKGDAATVTVTVTRMVRVLYHFQSVCCPTTDPPTAIHVANLSTVAGFEGLATGIRSVVMSGNREIVSHILQVADPATGKVYK